MQLPSPRRTLPFPLWCAILWLLALMLQWPLIANPGYFSHDELQWAAFADVPSWRQLPWVGWFDVGTFQYRPLTFNLWLLLSHALFERPLAFHLLWVALGCSNALLLALLLRQAGLAQRVAFVAALVFALNPYAAYVHGWVATLADLLWVGIGLGLTLWLQRRAAGGAHDRTAQAWVVAVVFVATMLALLAKEAAIVFPALALLALLLGAHRRVWTAATVGSAAAAALYLAVRLGPLLQGAQPGSGYALSLWQPPQRWLEYNGYPWLPTLFEIQSLPAASTPRLFALALVSLAVLWALWCAKKRYVTAWVIGGAAVLGPVLILTHSANQYGYGFSALACGIAALAWPGTATAGRVVLAGAAALVLWHGVNVQQDMRRVGELQARFSPALAAAVQRHAAPEPLSLQLEAEGDRWIYTRLTHAIASYDGVPIGKRVRLAPSGERGDYRIAADGTLSQLPKPAP